MKTGFILFHCGIINIYVYIFPKLLDALYQPEELANMSLSGNACPSMPGSKSKPEIPKEALNEIMVVLSDIYVCSLECVIMPNIMCRVLKYKVEFNSKF
ncbi:hypothetical protein DAPPUDRAFT_333411 [Daphnia pulex]|uniref:Uncharacterized protein n=1 Tax=Daphnia pulex TaxID=6669 RepID=E9HSR1_DAPPU|nr:hypothetical protein DAPPUDRAFT_333411 [Daphnia pulex]|eukprot:EFX65205.1 hypothetical protein DAPPUDRAFT_333411 [Daphnia pulex]